jgi:outer membrane protein assembly factor BamA
VSRGFEAAFVGNTYVEREYRYLQRDQSGTGFLTYPFSRAWRVEFSGGYRRIGQSYDLTTRTYSLSGQQLDEEETPLQEYPTLNLGEASTALVYDTSIFGATSPIRGSRYRMEFMQSGGSLTYSSVLADMRTYLMPVRPYTIALRGMYYGRLGDDAEDQMLPALYLGYPGQVRGYDQYSFESSECVDGSTVGSCPAYDRLIGSRVAIANAELRFPIWGAFGGTQFYGPLPIEGAFFADAGIAWGQSLRAGTLPGDHEPVVSLGAAIRINVFNFAVAEIDFVKPLDRPTRGWMWQFQFRPGF